MSIVTGSGQRDSANMTTGDTERTLLKVMHDHTHWIRGFKTCILSEPLGIQSACFMTDSIFTLYLCCCKNQVKEMSNEACWVFLSVKGHSKDLKELYCLIDRECWLVLICMNERVKDLEC